jgi:hypothetical protein
VHQHVAGVCRVGIPDLRDQHHRARGVPDRV